MVGWSISDWTTKHTFIHHRAQAMEMQPWTANSRYQRKVFGVEDNRQEKDVYHWDMTVSSRLCFNRVRSL